ncbi:MAG: aldo/keto reductase [Halobacteriales archaeon]
MEWFGPIDRVRSADTFDLWPADSTHDPERPTHVEATLSFADGPAVRLTASFYAPHRSREFTSLEMHGDDGSLYLEDAGDMGGSDDPRLSFGRRGRAYTPMPLQTPPGETPYLAGVESLVASVRNGTPDRRAGKRAAHIVTVCEAIEEAATADTAIDIKSTVTAADRQPTIRTPDHHGSKAALRLPAIGFGCSRYRDGKYVDRTQSIEIALDAGYRLLDSAELYGNEHRIGEILSAPGSPRREAIFLISKVWNTNHDHISEACETTLEDLGTEYLDCYMLHWPEAWAYTGPLQRLAEFPVEKQEALTFPEDDDGEIRTADVSLKDTWRKLESLYDRGIVRTLGLCNVERSTLDAVLDFARVPPAVVQIERHPYQPRAELVGACHQHGIRVIAHSPLSAPGLLEEPTLTSVAAEAGMTPAQAALAWHVTRGIVPIPSSTERDHIVENLTAARMRLSCDQLARIDTLADPDFER